MTQAEKVLRHMQTFGSITPLEAMEQYGIMRLGARIWDLKKTGLKIRTETETGKNRFGEPTQWARYSLKDEEVQRG